MRSLRRPGYSTDRCPTDRCRFRPVPVHTRTPGLAREPGIVLAMAWLGALLGLSIPIASGILVDQVIPAADLPSAGRSVPVSRCPDGRNRIFQAIQGLMVLRIEGRVSATLIPAVWDRLLRLPSRFLRPILRRRPGPQGDGTRGDLPRRYPGRSFPPSSPASSRSSTWACSITTVGNWPSVRPSFWSCCFW